MSQEPISIIVLEPVVDSMAALVRALEQTPQAELITVPSVAEAHQVALQFQPCVMLISLRGSLDGAMQVDLLKKVEKPIRSGMVKPLLISTVKNHPMAGVISTIGVKDYVVEPTTTKSLMFKMNLFFKAINAQREKAAAALKNNETRVFKAKPAEEEKANTVSSTKAIGKYKPALQLAEDTFLFKRAQPRKINSKILLEAEGPSPETGEWIPQATKPNEIQKWKWKPKLQPGEEPVDQEDGSGWIHEGEKPTFSGNPGRWLMSSTKPRLDYFRGGEAIANKVETDEHGEVLIADDSQAARENLILNKTIAQQAQELQLKKALEEQESEELKKLMVVEKPKPKREKTSVDASETEEEKDPFTKIAKKIREKKRELRVAAESAPAGEASPDWNDSIAGESEESSSLKQNGKHVVKDASGKILELNEDAEKNSALKAELELKTREKPLEGIDQNELESDKNLRRPVAKDLQRNIQGEKLPEGLDEEQLKDDVNLREKLASRLKRRASNQAVVDDDSKPLDELAKRNREKRQRKNLFRNQEEKKPRPSREELEKLAKQKIKEILELMAEEENTPIPEEETDSASTPEELSARKEKLGLDPETEIEAKELRRLEKADRQKKRKKEVAELEEAIQAGEGPLQAIFFAEEQVEWNEEESKERVARERNFRAIESADADLYEQDEKLGALKRQKRADVEENEASDEYYYLSQSEVQPLFGKWIYAEEQWMYIGREILESGFDTLEELLPTWIFDGLEEPLLLTAEEKWRFKASVPYLVQSPGEISFALKDSLKAYTKTKVNQEKRKASAEKRDLEEADREAAERRKKEAKEIEAEELDRPPTVQEKLHKNNLFTDPSLEQEVSKETGKQEKEALNPKGFGNVIQESEAKPGFGKVQLDEMLQGKLGKVKLKEDFQRESEFSFERATSNEDFKFTLKELIVFVKINDVKRSALALETEIPKIIQLMQMAFPHLIFECVKDTAPLGLTKSAESLHPAGCLLVSTTAEQGSFSQREKMVTMHFAKALALLLARENATLRVEAA